MRLCKVCRAQYRGEPTTCPLDGSALVPLPDPLIGRTIGGQYVIEEKIGSGGMGSVYRARQDPIDRSVAVKFLSPELALDATNRTRFLREARAANKIHHEHIIDITDYGESEDGLVWLVMEYLEGVPLDREVSRGKMPIERALRISLQIAQALARAHELDVIHRDIKPENIYLLAGYEGDFVKILDFGLAQMKGEMKITATGTVFGTPEYMAPEQARGATATAAVDLYALGCVLYELLTGRLPFMGNTPDLILKHIREIPAPPSRFVPSIPQEVDALVLKLLQKKPQDRPANAWRLAEDIKGLIEQLFGPQRAASSRPPPARLETTQRGVAAEDAWQDRVDTFRMLVSRAHPHGDAPRWLVPAIDSLSERVREMRSRRAELDRRSADATRREDGAREARERIGHAIDELGRDEARVLRAIEQTEARLAETRARLTGIEEPLRRGWAELGTVPAASVELARDAIEKLRDIGSLAGMWIEAERSVAAVKRDLADRQQEHEDLRFQIAQLKGRLGGLNAERDLDRGGAQGEIARIARELQQLVDGVVQDAEPIVRHFMSFPELRDIVLGGSRRPAPTRPSLQ